jgi:hypothetical protein
MNYLINESDGVKEHEFFIFVDKNNSGRPG